MRSLSAYKKLVCMKCFWVWIGTGVLGAAFIWGMVIAFRAEEPSPLLSNACAVVLLIILLCHTGAAICVNYWMYKDLFLEIRSTYRMIRYGEEETENEETEEGRLSS